jgi:putative oxidoreductase
MDRMSHHMTWNAIMRIIVGCMFIFTGISKLMDTSGPIGMLTGLGFPAPTIFAWILLLSEIVFGLCILIGFKTKWTAWPLVIVLAVAEIMVVIPNAGFLSVNSFFHLITIAALIMFAMGGPGKWAFTKHH